MRYLLFLLSFSIAVFFYSSSIAQSKLDSITILKGRVKMLAPVTLTTMSDEMWAFKYRNKPRPILVLSDEDAEINLIAHLTNQPAQESQINEFKEAQIKQLKKQRPDLTFIDSGVRLINGKHIGYFKFISQAIDQKVFNYYFFAILDEKILLFTFNCIEKLQNTWENTADKIVASLQIN